MLVSFTLSPSTHADSVLGFVFYISICDIFHLRGICQTSKAVLFFYRMPSTVQCDVQGCGVRIAADGHHQSVHHFACTQNHVYDPQLCAVCRQAATSVLGKCPCASQQLVVLKSRWRNLQKLSSADRMSPYCHDPTLAICLGLTQKSSPTPSLSRLLLDHTTTKRMFMGFQSPETLPPLTASQPTASTAADQAPESQEQPRLPQSQSCPPPVSSATADADGPQGSTKKGIRKTLF